MVDLPYRRSKVIDAFRDALEITDEDVSLTRVSLKSVGNLSSASVLFRSCRHHQGTKNKKGDLGLLVAMGPGFCCEMVLLNGNFICIHRAHRSHGDERLVEVRVSLRNAQWRLDRGGCGTRCRTLPIHGCPPHGISFLLAYLNHGS